MTAHHAHSDIENRFARRLARPLAVFAAVSMATSLAACGGSEAGGSASAGDAAAPSDKVDSIAEMVPDAVAEKGTLVVAAGVYPPAVIEPVGGGEPSGWDIENARQIAAVLGLEPEFKIIPFDGVITGLAADRYDAAVGEIYITPERTEQVTFVSNHVSADALMVKADSDLESAEKKDDLCGLTLAAQLGSAEADLINEIAKDCTANGLPAAQAKTFKSQAEVNLALDGGRIDAAVSSASQVANVLNETGDKFRLIELPWAPTYQTGMALARNENTEALAEAVQAATDHLIEDGTMQEILDEYNEGQGAIDKAEILPKTGS